MHDFIPAPEVGADANESDKLEAGPGLSAIADHIALASRNLDLLWGELSAQLEDIHTREKALANAGVQLEAEQLEAEQHETQLDEHARALESERTTIEKVREDLERRELRATQLIEKLAERAEELEFEETAAHQLHERTRTREHAINVTEKRLSVRNQQLERIADEIEKERSEWKERVAELEATATQLDLDLVQLDSRERALDVRESECACAFDAHWSQHEKEAELIVKREAALRSREEAFETVQAILGRLVRAMATPTRENIEAAADEAAMVQAVGVCSTLARDETVEAGEQDRFDPNDETAMLPPEYSIPDETDTVGCGDSVQSRDGTADNPTPQGIEESPGNGHEPIGFRSEEDKRIAAIKAHEAVCGEQVETAGSTTRNQRETLDVSDLTAAELQKFHKLSRMSSEEEHKVLDQVRAARDQDPNPRKAAGWRLRRRVLPDPTD